MGAEREKNKITISIERENRSCLSKGFVIFQSLANKGMWMATKEGEKKNNERYDTPCCARLGLTLFFFDQSAPSLLSRNHHRHIVQLRLPHQYYTAMGMI